MNTRTLCLLFGCLALPVSVPERAAAHGVLPTVSQIVQRAPNDVVVATSRGLMFGDPTTKKWSLLCGASFGAPDETPYHVAPLPAGKLLVASLEGLTSSTDDGCTWEKHATMGDADVTYLAQDPARPERVLISIFGGAQSGIHVSDDGGVTFRRLYAAAPDEFLGSLLIGAGSPAPLYASISTTDETPRFFVLRSTDDGVTWARTALKLGDDVLDVGLLASNPKSASELLLRVYHFDQRAGDDLMRSTDGGASFTQAAHFLGIADGAFSTDGSKVFLATGEGLMRAQASDLKFAKVGDEQSASHVTLRDGQALAGVAFASSDPLTPLMPGIETLAPDATTPPTRVMTFDQVTQPRSCPAPSTVGCACQIAWADWSIEFPETAATAPECEGPAP